MKNRWLIIVAGFLGLTLVGVILRSLFLNRGKWGALSISTIPKATVFIDGERLGDTPFLSNRIKKGERIVKLVPETTSGVLGSWETKVNLLPDILTVINRTFGSSESSSSGYIMWLEKISAKDKAALAFVSSPSEAVVKIEGDPKGFTPLIIEDYPPGTYEITIVSPGYKEIKLNNAKIMAGFKLVINAQLAKEIEGIQEVVSEETQKESASPLPTPQATSKPSPVKPYVKIKETPTGWLRVRIAPSMNATEAAKVYPNQTFPYLNEEENGWYKIEYEEGKEGWVSGVYAELIE